MLIKDLVKGIRKKKVKLFMLFLGFSFITWFLGKLSASYTQNLVFEVNYINVPENLRLVSASTSKVHALVTATGYQFLSSKFVTKEIDIDVTQVVRENGQYVLKLNQFLPKIKKQLKQNITLQAVEEQQLAFKMEELKEKKVKVIPQVAIIPKTNFMILGDVTIQPDSIVVKGPASVLAKIQELRTEVASLENVQKSVSMKVDLITEDWSSEISMAQKEVQIQAEIAKFSEKIFIVPVQIRNLEEGLEVKTFPKNIELLCQAPVELLKKMSASDFVVSGDFGVVNSQQSTLSLEIMKVPPKIKEVRLLQNKVEFLVKRK